MSVCSYESQCGMFQHCIQGICQHDLVFPISAETGIVYAIIPFLLGLGMIGGLGGGVLKGPVLMMMLNYSLLDSTIISYAIIFGGSLLNTAQLIFTKHPKYPKSPIINFEIAMISNCAISLGSNIGSTLNILTPPFYVTIIQEIFLLSIIPYLWTKARKERQLMKQQRQENQIQLQQQQPQEQIIEKNGKPIFELQNQPILPLVPILIIFGFFALTQILLTLIPYLVKNLEMNLPNCFTINYLLLIILISINPSLTYLVYRYGKQQELKRKNKFYVIQSDLFIPRVFLKLYGLGFLSGLTAGLLGLGAGLVMVPALLSIGLLPTVVTAISNINNQISALNNLITLLTKNLLPIQVTFWFAGLALIGGSIITKIGYAIVKKYKLSYAIILIVIGLAVTNLVAGIWYLIIQSNRFGFGTLLQSKNLCS